MHKNLSDFISILQKNQEIVTINHPVNPHLEIAEIHRRVIAANGPALLFTQVKGSKFPLVSNLFGSRRRIDLAFGKAGERLIADIARLPVELLPPKISKLWGWRGNFVKLARVGFKSQAAAPILENRLPGGSLDQLPALTSWPEDGGPFLTLPLVHTRCPQTEQDNLGIYRVQIHNPDEAGMHFQIAKGGGFHLHKAEEISQDLPANIYLGGPPGLILSAIAPLPENVPELLLGALLQGTRLGRVPLNYHPLDLVAEADFALVGHVPQKVRRPEGPFGDHYGYYSLKHDYPVFRPQAMYHRKNAVYPATVVGKPRQEDFYLGDYLQDLLSPLFPLVMPGVVDIWSYGETGYHSLSAAVLKERYARESLSSVFRILGEGQLSLTKFLLVLDQPMDLRDFKAVLSHCLARVDWSKDLLIFDNTAMDSLDYCGPKINHGSKGVLMGLGEARRELPQEFSGQTPPRTEAKSFCPGCLVLQSDLPPQELSAWSDFEAWPLLVLVDSIKQINSASSFLWTAFTRFNPAQDLHPRKAGLQGNRIVYEGPLTIDARMKSGYPGELFCDEETSKLVESQWRLYFPDHSVEMGSSDRAHLDE